MSYESTRHCSTKARKKQKLQGHFSEGTDDHLWSLKMTLSPIPGKCYMGYIPVHSKDICTKKFNHFFEIHFSPHLLSNNNQDLGNDAMFNI